MATLRVAFLSALVLELLATLSVALVAVGVGLRLVEGGLDLQTGLLVLILAPEAYLPLRMVGIHYHASAEGMEAAQRVFEVLDEPVPPRASTRACPVPRSVLVRGLAVTYPGRHRAAVSEVDLTLRAGEVVALAGPSGGGKSSVVAALMGFVAPSAGGIEVVGDDGAAVPLADVDLESWRAHLGWAPQRPHLFAAGLAQNVRLARPGASDADVADALRAAAADELVGSTQLDVGDGGTGLSAGQRRRVALARAFVRDAPVLLLDEPTADLDAVAEARVLAAVRARAQAGAAVLLVAHRPELLAFADRVVQIGSGPGAILDPTDADERPAPVGFGAGL
jgi:ABC-type transport system involved in cytochrome bd biosynthesis fused ATPase/permease subunit